VIRSEYRDPDLGLADVAAAVAISPRQLQRVFREESGEDFRGYLLRVRMEKAAELLSRDRNPLPVHVTARRVGYGQASGLRQAFLRFHGYNPSMIQREPPDYLRDVDYYLQRIEDSRDRPVELAAISEALSSDRLISGDARKFLASRIAQYGRGA